MQDNIERRDPRARGSKVRNIPNVAKRSLLDRKSAARSLARCRGQSDAALRMYWELQARYRCRSNHIPSLSWRILAYTVHHTRSTQVAW